MATNSSCKASNPNFTAKELEMIVCALQINQNEVKIDYGVLAERMGYNGKASASVVWGRVRKKLLSFEVGSSSKIATETPRQSPSKKPPGMKALQREDDESPVDKLSHDKTIEKDDGESPTKKRKTCSRYITSDEALEAQVKEEADMDGGMAQGLLDDYDG